MMNIFLGSSSPRRRQILTDIGCRFEVIKPETDESVNEGETAEDYCLRVASEKRDSLIEKMPSDGDILLIASDTTVSYKHHILGKPENHEDAVRMLSLLQGKTHQVLSALALYARIGGKESRYQGIESTDVEFKVLGLTEIEKYLSSIEYMDKAGSYAAQENGLMIIKKMTGSATNVIGFPLGLFFRMLGQAGIAEAFNQPLR